MSAAKGLEAVAARGVVVAIGELPYMWAHSVRVFGLMRPEMPAAVFDVLLYPYPPYPGRTAHVYLNDASQKQAPVVHINDSLPSIFYWTNTYWSAGSER